MSDARSRAHSVQTKVEMKAITFNHYVDSKVIEDGAVKRGTHLRILRTVSHRQSKWSQNRQPDCWWHLRYLCRREVRKFAWRNFKSFHEPAKGTVHIALCYLGKQKVKNLYSRTHVWALCIFYFRFPNYGISGSSRISVVNAITSLRTCCRQFV